jgi:hypothetical protein
MAYIMGFGAACGEDAGPDAGRLQRPVMLGVSPSMDNRRNASSLLVVRHA